jgi:hypothetical protein
MLSDSETSNLYASKDVSACLNMTRQRKQKPALKD